MVDAIYEIKGVTIKNETLISFERQILILFGFDFNFGKPITFLQRYQQVLNCQDDEKVFKSALVILMLQLFDDELLEFNSSQIAAVTLILAINIVKMFELIEKLMKGEIDENTDCCKEKHFFNLVS